MTMLSAPMARLGVVRHDDAQHSDDALTLSRHSGLDPESLLSVCSLLFIGHGWVLLLPHDFFRRTEDGELRVFVGEAAL